MTATASRPINVLLQTTIPYAEDDWHIGRFSLLRDYINGLKTADGEPLANVTARNREPDANGVDPILASIETSPYDQVWLFGVDTGGDTGISKDECKAGVGAPKSDPRARVVATGTSTVTNRPFNIAVAFDAHDGEGRGWAQSTFHHFCDYNWDTSAGCPSFVTDKPSDAIAKKPSLLDDTKRYVRNLVEWLGRRPR